MKIMLPFNLMERVMTLQQLIWDYRHQNNLSLRAMGALLGCSGAFVGKLEKEEVFPSAALMKSIANVVGVSLEDLIRITYRKEGNLYKTYMTEAEMRRRT